MKELQNHYLATTTVVTDSGKNCQHARKWLGKRSWGKDVYSASEFLPQVGTPGGNHLLPAASLASREGLSVTNNVGHACLIWKKWSGAPSKGHATEWVPMSTDINGRDTGRAKQPLHIPDNKT